MLNNFSTRTQWLIGGSLITLMLLTRGRHLASIEILPAASWAIFFLAGFYLRNRLGFPVLFTLAVSIDLIAVTWGGVSNFCISPAYPFLLPAYGALWFVGRSLTIVCQFNIKSVALIISGVLLSSFVAELLSSGGFYFFSGRFSETSMSIFYGRLLQYYPSMLASMAFYVGFAAILHIAFHLNNRSEKVST